MKTWNDYKRHVKTVDPTSGKDISNIEEQVAIISEIVKARKELGLKITLVR